MKKIALLLIAAGTLLSFTIREKNKPRPFESNRVLIILQENTGKLDVLPENTSPEFKSLFTASVDRIAETFEDIKSDLQGAALYERVIHLTDVKCTKTDLLNTLIAETLKGNQIDLFCFGHGSPNKLILHDKETLTGGASGTIRKLLADARAAKGSTFNFNLRLVYMCECYGATTNDDWLAIGAETSVGSQCVNFMAEPMITLFTHKYVLENKPAATAALESFNEAKAVWSAANVLAPVLGYGTPVSSDFGCVKGQDKYETSRPLVAGNGSLKFNPLAASFVIPTSFRSLGDNLGTTADDNLAEGTYQIINAASTSNKQLGVSSGCDDALCRAQLDGTVAANNRWVIRKIDGVLGGYTIRNAANDKYLDADLSLPGGNIFMANVFENGCKVNTAARISPALPRTNQEWKIVHRGSGKYTIKCIMSGLYLDAANACVNQNGCAVQLWEDYSQASQKWKFVRVN